MEDRELGSTPHASHVGQAMTDRDIRGSRKAFWCGVLAPTCLGVGAWGFFLMPESAPLLLTFPLGLGTVMGVYLLFLRYDFEVDRRIEEAEIASDYPRFAAFNPKTIIHLGQLGGISRHLVLALSGLAAAVLASGIVFAISQISNA